MALIRRLLWSMPFIILQQVLLTFTNTHGEIIRKNKRQFFGGFTLVTSNMKMIEANVLSCHKKVSLRDCVKNCILEEGCESVNHHKYSNDCETLNSTTTVTEYLLVRKTGWVHYEGDPSYPYNGHYCESVKPCPSPYICHDTYSTPNPYTCRCEEGFDRKGCKNYIGFGKDEAKPARSCLLLKRKYNKKLSNGYYWLRGNNKTEPAKQTFCDFKHEEGPGKSERSAIESCGWLRETYPDVQTGQYWVIKNDQKQMKERSYCRSVEAKKNACHFSTRKNGYCVTKDGKFSEGIKKLNSIDPKNKRLRVECLIQCEMVPNATGCQVIWGKSNAGCYVHTGRIVDKDSGNDNHLCWIFSKCRGRGHN